MDKYLLEILKDVNTIIIPGLGALTITNTETGEIMFMPYLKHDDGKLSSYISEKEGMDENEAKNLIAKYVRDIQTKLDQGDSYDMFQFGSFVKDEEGDVEFKNWDKAKPNVVSEPIASAEPAAEKIDKSEDKKEEELKAKKAQEAKEAEAEKEKAAAKTEAENKQTELAAAKKKEEAEKEAKAKADAKKKAAELEETKKADELAEQKKLEQEKANSAVKAKPLNIEEKEEITKNVEKLETLRQQQEDKKDKKKRGVGFYMLMTLVVVLIAGGTYVGLNYDSVKQHIPFLADKTETPKVNHDELDKMKETMGDDEPSGETDMNDDNSEENMEESNEESKPDVQDEIQEEKNEAPTKEESVDNSIDGTPYHIVAGAFSSPENAERLAASLRDQGHPAKAFARGNQTIVSLSSHSTKTDASSALKAAKDVVPKGWILYWK